MRRGEVFAYTPPSAHGREQAGSRYGVIVHSDALLPRSVVIVAPTSTSAWPASYRPEIVVRKETTRVLVEQMRATDVGRLGRRVGHVTVEEQWEIDEALRAVLGLR